MSERARIREGVLYCLKVFLAVRIGLFLLGYAAVSLLEARIVYSLPGWPQHAVTPGLHNVFTAFERQDALWYLKIAATGYRPGDGSAAFFPLLPLAIRGVSAAIGGHPFAAGLIVANLSFFGALCVLYFLTSSELSEPLARKTVLYVSIFPAAFFFLAPYSEAPFLLLSVTAFWAARRGKWPAAGITGALAALTRGVGLFLLPALAVEAVRQWRDKEGPLAWRLSWSAFVGAGTLAYLGYWNARSGDWLAPLRFQSNWQRVAMAPWTTLWRGTRIAFDSGGYFLLDWIIVVPMLVAAVFVVRRFRPAYGLYTWLCLLAPLGLVFPPRPLMSLPRFVLPLFPIFWVLAQETERRRIPEALVVGVGAAGLGLLTVLFVNSYFVF